MKVGNLFKEKVLIGIVFFVIGTVFGILVNDFCVREIREAKQSSLEVSSMPVSETFYLKKNSGVKLMGLTINSVNLTEDRNEFSKKEAKKVVEIEYTYENLGYNENLYVSDLNFKIYDKSGNILETYPIGGDKVPQSISKGKKCTANMSFALNDNSNDLEVEFYENIFDDNAMEKFYVTAKE